MSTYRKFVEIMRQLFPILQPEWIRCRYVEVPAPIATIFDEEEMYQRTLNKTKFNIRIRNYLLKCDLEKANPYAYYRRRVVSIIEPA